MFPVCPVSVAYMMKHIVFFIININNPLWISQCTKAFSSSFCQNKWFGVFPACFLGGISMDEFSWLIPIVKINMGFKKVATVAMKDLIVSEVIHIDICSHSHNCEFIFVRSWSCDKLRKWMSHSSVWITLNLTNSVVIGQIKDIDSVVDSCGSDGWSRLDWWQAFISDCWRMLPSEVVAVVDVMQLPVSLKVNVVGWFRSSQCAQIGSSSPGDYVWLRVLPSCVLCHVPMDKFSWSSPVKHIDAISKPDTSWFSAATFLSRHSLKPVHPFHSPVQ